MTKKQKAAIGTVSDQDRVNTIRVAVEQLAQYLTDARASGIEVNFGVGPSDDDPNLIVPKNFKASKVLG
jgi:hypothetical protein